MTDVFRKTYKILKPEYSKKILEMKECAEKLYEFMDINSREMSVAKTNLEQSIMWATKAIVLDNEKCSQQL